MHEPLHVLEKRKHERIRKRKPSDDVEVTGSGKIEAPSSLGACRS